MVEGERLREGGTVAEAATVLLVDDDQRVLSALTRLLRPDGVGVLSAASGEEALVLLEEHGASIGAVISDYAMPGMNGAELLRAVRLRWPDITRVLLTGNADLPAAAQAVNEGQLSRLYTKPWRPDEFRQAVFQALEQHRLLGENRRLRALADEQAARLEQWNERLEVLVAERSAELERANAGLHQALLDTVRLLLTFLERRLPERAARCRESARLAGRLAERAGLSPDEARRVQVAALVHDIGLMGLPDALLRRSPAELPLAGRLRYEQHAVIGQSMLGAVDQLADMALWIRHHHERWDGQGYPDRLAEAAIPLASRIIAVADGYQEAIRRDGGTATAWRRAHRTSGAFDPELLMLLSDEVEGRSSRRVERTVRIAELHEGMVLAEPVRTAAGTVLLHAGEALRAEHVVRIQHLLANGALATESVVAGLAPSDASMRQPTSVPLPPGSVAAGSS